MDEGVVLTKRSRSRPDKYDPMIFRNMESNTNVPRLVKMINVIFNFFFCHRERERESRVKSTFPNIPPKYPFVYSIRFIGIFYTIAALIFNNRLFKINFESNIISYYLMAEDICGRFKRIKSQIIYIQNYNVPQHNKIIMYSNYLILCIF